MPYRLRKIITYILTIAVIISQLNVSGYGVVKSYAATTQMANVVLFVDFQDTDHNTHISDTGVGDCFTEDYQTTIDLFDGSDTVNTGMAEYLENISYGQFKQVNIFPQYNQSTGKLTPFTVSRNASEYVDINSSLLLSEVLDQLENSNLLDDSIDVDLNDDGLIDNVTMVVAYTDKDADGNDIFTSHKSNYGGNETVNGLKVGSYNLVTESGAYLGLQESGLLIHEFMHSLGYPDLYKVGASDNSSQPVGLWDIMASNTYRVQYPLAYLRAHYTGWFDIPTVTSDVNGYTIYSALAATAETKDNQALILKTDYSDTEFFVVEYRQKGAYSYDYFDYDSHIYGSGLIVYRVNTTQEKNIAKETDLIYVFRPGDTYDDSNHEAGQGDLTKSFLSAESGRTSYGSSDYQATLEDGAITYSDGTNSGIVISNVGSAAGDTITFDVSFGDGAESIGGFWNTEAIMDLDNMVAIDSCMDDAGNIYAVTGLTTATGTGSNGAFEVYKYNQASGWSKLGGTVSVNGGFHKILIVNNVPYVACTDYSNARINLYAYNNGWERVYHSANAGDEFDIATDGQRVYIAYNSPYSYGTTSKIYCESYGGGNEISYGVALEGNYLCNPYLDVYNGNPVLVARDVFDGNVINVSKYSGDTKKWISINNQLKGDTVCSGVYGDTLYLMKNGDGNGNYSRSYVYSLKLSSDSASFSQLGTNEFIDNSAVPMNMFFYDDSIYIAYQNGDIDARNVYVKTLVNNQWKPVGTKVTRDGILGISGNAYNDTIYMVYGNTTSGITIKHHVFAEDADQVGGGNQGETGNSGGSGGDSGSTGGDTGNTGGTTGGNTGNTGGTTSGDTGNTGGNAGGNTGGNSGNSDSTETFVAPDINVNYRTHIQNYGWEGDAEDIATWCVNGEMSGTSGESKRLEGINIVVNPATACEDLDLGIQYTTHCQNYGWLPWSADGDMNGTEGESKRLEAIIIKLTGEHADCYDVYYRVHAQNYGWLGWAKNGEAAGTAGYSKRLEGIQIVVVKKDEDFNRNIGGIDSIQEKPFEAKEGSSPIVNYPATSNTNPIVPGAEDVNVTYRTHVQTYGWQGWKYNGQMSGTEGESKRLEGIEIKLTNKDYDGGIAYTTHVQTYGWQGDEEKPSTWMTDGEMSGTSGESKRLEAIRIKLTGDLADNYDIYYRVHAQSYGWLGWASNGEAAGTAGYSKRLEGIQIVIVPRGDKAPSSTYMNVEQDDPRAYISR